MRAMQLRAQGRPLENANQALDDLRHGRFTGAAVIDVAGAASFA